MAFCAVPGSADAAESETIDIKSGQDLVNAADRINAAAEEEAFVLNILDNISVSGKINLKRGNVTIYGGGYVLTVSGGITAEGNTVLNLGAEDYPGTLQLTNGGSMGTILTLYDNSRLNVYDGVTIGPSTSPGTPAGVATYDLSEFNMYGGKITDCVNLYSVTGGVYIENSSVFNMYGGTIENCSGCQGGAVGISGASPIGPPADRVYAKFNMYGGEIKNCTDNWYGGGAVCMYGTSPTEFNMYGGTITGCYAANTEYGYGGAVMIYSTSDEAVTRISGGEIRGNSANYGAGIFIFDGEVTIEDGVGIYDNNAELAGDDVYINGGKVTLGKVGMSYALSDCGHGIDGWYDDGETRWGSTECGSSEGHTEPFSDTGTVLTGELALKAAHGDLISVSYDVNGGIWKETSPEYSFDSETGLYSLTVSGSSAEAAAAPERDGYIFKCWDDGAENTYGPDDVITISQNVTLTAVWQTKSPPVTYYTLSYESNGGTEYPNERYAKNRVVMLDKVPAKENFTFTGWYSDEECTDKITSVVINGNKTVYAGWEKTGVPPYLNGKDHVAYIIGYDDGLVHPNENITRAEVATIFFRLLNDSVRDENMTESNSFGDVSRGQWFNTAVSTMAELDILKGYPNGDFGPLDRMTRGEFAAVCARFDGRDVSGEASFSDIDGHWAKPDIIKASENGWINGYSDGTFGPDRYITRAEAVAMINRVLGRNPEKESDLLSGMKEWDDNMDTDQWYYIDVQEASNSHEYSRRQNYSEYWTKICPGPDWGAIEK